MKICEKQIDKVIDLKLYKDRSSEDVLLCVDYYACKLYGKYTFAIPKVDNKDFFLFDFEEDADEFLLMDCTHVVCGRRFISIKTDEGVDVFEIVGGENDLRLHMVIENAFSVEFSVQKIMIITTYMTKLSEEVKGIIERVKV